MSRFIMSALLCTFAFAQSAHAIAPAIVAKRTGRELAALQAKDPNDDKTAAGMKFKEEKKKECKLAGHQGSRNENTQPQEQVAAVSGGKASGKDTVQ
jgi:hypothetical protein